MMILLYQGQILASLNSEISSGVVLSSDLSSEVSTLQSADSTLSTSILSVEENALTNENGAYIVYDKYIQFSNWRIGENDDGTRLVFYHKDSNGVWSPAIPFISSA
jgi:hypothetical protein